MSFYAVPYRVLFHDTMAYGSHHFLTNLKFQCVGREQLFFQELVDRGDTGAALRDDHVFLTQQVYARNLAPVGVGQRVVILVSIEDQGATSAVFCFRVIRADGVPVSAGFQGIVCLSRETGEPIAVPAAMRSAGVRVAERLTGPPFRDRVLSGRIREIFDEETRALARQIAQDAGFPGDGRYLDMAPAEVLPTLTEGPVFLFPGQGGYERETLLRLAAQPGAGEILARIDRVGQRMLGESMLAALHATPEEHDLSFRRTPDLAQLGIYAVGLLAAAEHERSHRPTAFVGHSLGEITALAAAGILSVEDGAAAVCLRCQALAASGASGGMLALIGPEAHWRAALEKTGLQAAVINHGEQIVVAGALADLERLEQHATGLQTVRLRSPYPFHSALLANAVRPFSDALAGLPIQAPRIPVYSPLERVWFTDAHMPTDLGPRLAQHLIRPLDFRVALAHLGSLGAREFAVCGPGEAPASFAPRVLGSEARVLRLPAPAPVPPAAPRPAMQEVPRPEPAAARNPIAIVAAGSVLPGALGLDGLAAALAVGRVGLSDAGVRDPLAALDFCAPGPVRPDKTYTLLGGFIPDLPEPPPAFSPEEVAAMSAAERLLAAALHECLEGLNEAPTPSRTALVLGSTADGIREQDEALLVAALTLRIEALDAPPAVRDALIARLNEGIGTGPRPCAELAPLPTAQRVGERLVGPGLRALLVDAACASSLYAVDHGVRALRGGHCDLALCGGFFAPGPANSCLFSQFRGLSATGSRPLDVGADGVVFGEGAVVLALRRLSDAVAAGEPVLAIIREVGTSSDGWSPSVALPGREGQELAMRRALGDQPHLDYLEAHATSTPVGDAVEYSAVRAVLGDAEGPIDLGSLKALTGHTGWTAGAASLLKICLSWRAGTIPLQPSWTAPSPRIPLAAPFRVSTATQPWAPRADGRPRRAGVNGFGFGGSDAHVLLEEPGAVPLMTDAPPVPRRRPMAVVGYSARFPDAVQGGSSRELRPDQLRLPPGRPVLPDVIDDMDRSQHLAASAAAEALAPVQGRLSEIRREVGVILGLEGKTAASLRINQRLYADRVHRVLAEVEGEEVALRDALLAEIDRIPVSGPYTLPGLMPNVAAGRVANLLDLMGPNLVLDAGADSLWEVLSAAEQILAEGRCRLVLAGGLNAVTAPELGERADRPLCEGALVMALCTPAEAERLGLPVLAALQLDDRDLVAPEVGPYGLRGAEGALALLDGLRAPERFAHVGWGRGSLRVLPPGVSTTPIHAAVPRRVALPPAVASAHTRARRRVVLLVADEGESWTTCQNLYDRVQVLRPAGRAGDSGATEIDLAEDPAATLDALGIGEADAVIALLTLDGQRGPEALAERALLELLFVCARAQAGATEPRLLGVLGLGAPPEGPLPPETGLYSGLVRALARELPQLRSVAVWSTATDLSVGLAQLDEEWAREPRGEVEVLRNGAARAAPLLHEINPGGPPPPLGPDAVVWLTGGARGITAAMAGALLEQSGCTVALLGRSRLEDAPDAMAQMTDAELDAEESAFYARARAQDPKASPVVLKRRYQTLRTAAEAKRTVMALQKLPGRVVYRSVDLTAADATAAVAEGLLADLGAPALVVHGAGVQVSGALAKRSLGTFREVVGTKLSGLLALHGALDRAGHQPPFHMLTSAFSFLGNDGQPDYGAANVAMDRLADALPGWSSIGWLGWAGLGMTRGSEYLALAKVRDMRPVSVPEGTALFLARLGDPTGGSTVSIGDGELGWYREALLGDRGARPGPSWTLDSRKWRPLAEHRVMGAPTLPGAFAVELGVRAALLHRPDWQLAEVRDLRFLRFLRVPDDRPVQLRATVQILSAEPDQLRARVWLRAPFVHASGRVLQDEVDHFSLDVILRPDGSPIPAEPLQEREAGAATEDPYVHPDGPISLGPLWPTLHDLSVADDALWGALTLRAEATAGFVTPALLLDALCRFSLLEAPSDGQIPLFVPLRCARLRFAPRVTDATVDGVSLRLHAPRPRSAPNGAFCAYVEARDPGGAVLLRLEGLRGHAAGAVQILESPFSVHEEKGA